MILVYLYVEFIVISGNFDFFFVIILYFFKSSILFLFMYSFLFFYFVRIKRKDYGFIIIRVIFIMLRYI